MVAGNNREMSNYCMDDEMHGLLKNAYLKNFQTNLHYSMKQ